MNSIHDDNTIIIIDYFKLLSFVLCVNRKKIKAKGKLEYRLANRMEDTDTLQIFELAIYVPLLSMAGIFASSCVIDSVCVILVCISYALPFVCATFCANEANQGITVYNFIRWCAIRCAQRMTEQRML